MTTFLDLSKVYDCVNPQLSIQTFDKKLYGVRRNIKDKSVFLFIILNWEKTDIVRMSK